MSRGRARWALERQVRLATAAVTDTCAMGAVLSRLPHNRGGRAVTLPDAVQSLRTHRTSGSAAP